MPSFNRPSYRNIAIVQDPRPTLLSQDKWLDFPFHICFPSSLIFHTFIYFKNIYLSPHCTIYLQVYFRYYLCILSCLSEKTMAPQFSTLAWKIPWMEEPRGLQSMGSRRVGHDWVTSLSRIGEGNGNPLQCSCLEDLRDGGAWWAAVYGSHRVGHDWSDLAAASCLYTYMLRNCVKLCKKKKKHKSLLPILLLIFLCLVYSKCMIDPYVIEFMEILRAD